MICPEKSCKSSYLRLSHNLSKVNNNTVAAWTFDRSRILANRIYDEKKKRISVDSLSDNTPLLLFRFSKVGCSTCIQNQISLIREFKNKPNIKSLIICDYKNERQLGLFKRINAISEEVYSCDSLVQNENKTPYFCILKNGTITNVFFPDNDFPNLTRNYLKSVSRNYFSSKMK